MKATLALSTALASLALSPVHAQAIAADESASTTGEIIVTARRVAERLADVPMAVTAITGQGLAEQGIKNVADLSRITPGISYTPPTTDPFTPVIAMRGQVQNDVSVLNADSSTGFYIDEFFLARPSALQGYGVFDLDRIEVLRGPQGTLFGRNATGGNLRYITKKAGGEFEGYVRGSYGRFDHVELEGAVNLPISGDRLALRVSGLQVWDDGYGKPLTTGRKTGDVNNTALRANLMARPSDNVTIDLSYHRFDGHGGNQVTRVTSVTPAVAAAYPAEAALALASRYGSLSSADRLARSKNDVYIASVTVDLTDEVTAQFNYGHFDLSLFQRIDHVPLGVISSENTTDTTNKQDSLEGRLSGNFLDGRLQLQGGVYWMKEKGRTDLILNTLSPPLGAGVNNMNFTTGVNKTLAFFGQGTFQIVPDKLDLTVGLRHTHDDRTSTHNNPVLVRAANLTICGLDTASAAGAALLVAPCTYGATKKDNYVSYLVSLDYKVDEQNMLYVKTARSYRGGGYNARGSNPGAFSPFQPEQVTEYEAGYKGRLANIFDLNLAVFYDRRRDGQVSAITINPASGLPTTAIINAINVNVLGIEAEGAIRVSDFLRLDASYSYLDKFLPFASQNRFVVGGTFTQKIGDDNLTARLDYTWQGKLSGTPPQGCNIVGVGGDARDCPNYVKAINEVPSFGLLNGRIAYRFANPRLEIALFGRNLTNKAYDGYRSDFRALGATWAVVGQPRTYGVEARFDF